MDFTYYFAFSIVIACIVSIIRFSQIRNEYFPFIYLMWLACINETVGFVLVKTGHYNIVNNNIYSLAEALLLLWFFVEIGTFKTAKKLPFLLLALFVLTWIIDNFILHRFGTAFNSYFNILCSFTLVLLAITSINHIIVKDGEVLKNPRFLICIAIIIFFTYMVLVESFWLYGPSLGTNFMSSVFRIQSWVNLFCNLIYAAAILWMQKKQPFTLQS